MNLFIFYCPLRGELKKVPRRILITCQIYFEHMIKKKKECAKFGKDGKSCQYVPSL